LRLDGLRVGGNRSARRKLTCLTWWPHYQQWEASVLTLRRPDSQVSAIVRDATKPAGLNGKLW